MKIIHLKNLSSTSEVSSNNNVISFIQNNDKTNNSTNDNNIENLVDIFNKYVQEAKELQIQNRKFERIPDIHPCTIPNRCLGTLINLCSDGSTGYQCNNCSKNYDMSYFKSKCKKCQNLFYEILHFILLKIIILYNCYIYMFP